MSVEIRDIDRRIWEEELESFLPSRIYDVHAHIYLREHCISEFEEGRPGINTHILNNAVFGHEAVQEAYARLLPAREVHSLYFGWVFEDVDFDAANQFAAEQASCDPLSTAFMLSPPSLTPDRLAEGIAAYGFRGLKPYFFWTEKRWDARITDIIPERLLEVANEKKLIVMLHFGKKMGIADEENIRDMVHLSARYPAVRWILPHCARSTVPWPLERAIERLKDLPNVWYDVSSVTDPAVYSLVFRNVPPDRIMYGSDVPVILERGQMIGWAYAWALLSEKVIAAMNLPHCDPSPTYLLYETLRAARRAIRREGWGPEQIENMFYNNAIKLLDLPADNAAST